MLLIMLQHIQYISFIALWIRHALGLRCCIANCEGYKHGYLVESEMRIYREFQKELYNLESLYKFIQRTCTVF
jgi:hypothetical protein